MKHIFKSRKFYSFLFALFILVSGVFSPFVIALQQQPSIKIQKALAVVGATGLTVVIVSNTSTELVIAVQITGNPQDETFKANLRRETPGENYLTNVLNQDFTSLVDTNVSNQTVSVTLTTNFDPGLTYYISANTNPATVISNNLSFQANGSNIVQTDEGIVSPEEGTNQVSTGGTPSGQLYDSCGFIFSGTIGGCFALFLDIIQSITHWVTSFAANFFDWAIFYTIQSSTYNINFISQGWVIVRDVANMAFIFVLLYIAIQTILGIGHDTKKNIAAVVIIALLINFSMFFSKVVIDAGNILAHAFYNNIQSGYLPMSTDVKDLSIAVVEKFQPQNLLSNETTTAIGEITPSDGSQQESTPTANKTRIFILVALMAIIADIMMIWVFLSVAFMMLGRIIALAFAIIISPIAFISNAVPGLKTAKYVGFDGWFKDLICLSFQPAVFIFFLFLILKFLSADTIFENAPIVGEPSTIAILKIMVPMIFIVFLIYIAMKIVKSCGGEIAAMISGAFGKIAAVGAGLALGGAALGTAALGRGTLGATQKFIQNDAAREKNLNWGATKDAVAKLKGQNLANPLSWGRYLAVGATALKEARNRPFAQIAQNKHEKETQRRNSFGQAIDANGTPVEDGQGAVSTVGKERQARAKDASNKAHAIHVLDKEAQKFKDDKNAKFEDLTEPEAKLVKEKIDKDVISKERYNKAYDDPRLAVADRDAVDLLRNDADPNGAFDAAANVAKHDAHIRGEHVHTAKDITTDSKADVAMGEFITALKKGSYDVRNMSQMKSTAGGLVGLGVKVMAGAALGIRMGLKEGAGVDHGKGEKDIWKDIGNSLKTAIKEGFQIAKMKVDLPQSVHTEDDHGGGHGGGHH